MPLFGAYNIISPTLKITVKTSFRLRLEFFFLLIDAPLKSLRVEISVRKLQKNDKNYENYFSGTFVK